MSLANVSSNPGWVLLCSRVGTNLTQPNSDPETRHNNQIVDVVWHGTWHVSFSPFCLVEILKEASFLFADDDDKMMAMPI